MQKASLVFSFVLILIITVAFKGKYKSNYYTYYENNLSIFKTKQIELLKKIENYTTINEEEKKAIKNNIHTVRKILKKNDFWIRYFEPNEYKKINGPLFIEWETEVFEKFEIPYQRLGSGLSLAEIYLENNDIDRDSLLKILTPTVSAIDFFANSKITTAFNTPDAFFFCNRLYLLNLAAIYTTGYECPSKELLIQELEGMLNDVKDIYLNHQKSFTHKSLSNEYLQLYDSTILFVSQQSNNIDSFDHFTFIKNFVNPLFSINQLLIQEKSVFSKSNMDYTLNNNASSIFDKSLYFAQNTKGVYSQIMDKALLNEIAEVGKLLFYDPILSANNERSCASCHNPETFFTDTIGKTSLQFNKKDYLERNTPSLINTTYNHLLGYDGSQLNLQDQAKKVITNMTEMGSSEKDVLEKVLSCKTYKTLFQKYLPFTITEKRISLNHIVSAITLYYGNYNTSYSLFDKAISSTKNNSNNEATKGFNLFMGKGQCATCHFLPTFSGIKPPFISNEFEVIGVPHNKISTEISSDLGRFNLHKAKETKNAFRTPTLRNISKTKPYMHNGSFENLDKVMDFYNNGGGSGLHFNITNQTLNKDSLRLTEKEKERIISFMTWLNEDNILNEAPTTLPISEKTFLNKRKLGGIY